MTDPVAEYSLEEAIRVGRDLEQLDYHWFENRSAIRVNQIRQALRRLDIPIAGTETTRGGPWVSPRRSPPMPSTSFAPMSPGKPA